MGVLSAAAEEIVNGAFGRLSGRAEFLFEASALTDMVERCWEALARAADGETGALVEAALAIAREDSDPGRGYRRGQLLLDALCAEAVAAVRRGLPRPLWRASIGRLRALLGPAQVGLAQVFRDQGGRPISAAGEVTGAPPT